GVLLGGPTPAVKACATDLDCNTASYQAPAHCSLTTGKCFRVDYSNQPMITLNEVGGLNESAGVGGPSDDFDLSFWHRGAPTPFVQIPAYGAVDWSKLNGFSDVGVTQEINGDAQNTSLNSEDDWATTLIGGVPNFTHLQFSYQCSSNFGAASNIYVV